MSQERLAEALGLTFQQVQKNERGLNRIGSSRLYQLSHILDVPVGYFFEKLEGEGSSSDDVMLKRETLCIAPGSLDTSLSHAAGLSDIAVCHA